MRKIKNVNGLEVCLILLILIILTPILCFYAPNGYNSLKASNNEENLKSASMEYEIIRISYNDVLDTDGWIDDGLIVWLSGVSGQSPELDVYLYNVSNAETTRITDNTYADRHLRIDDGLIVWSENVDGDFELFCYDTRLESPEPFRITYNDVTDHLSFVDDDLITWWSGGSVMLYDYNTHELIRIASGSYPKINNGLVVWASGGDIWLYDYKGILGAPRQIIQVTSDSYTNNDYYPQVHDGLILFYSNREVDGKTIVKLYLYNCYTGEIVHVGDPWYTYGGWLHDGLVAYKGAPAGNGEEIYVYDYSTGILTQITDNGLSKSLGAYVHDGLVGWTEGGRLVFYDTKNGEKTEIGPNQYVATPLFDDGLFLLYIGGEIYYARPASFTAELNLDPDILNLKSKGKWVTAYIELPAEYNVEDIDITTLLLQDSILAEFSPTCIGDHDDDGILDLMVKFDRTSLQSLLSVGDSVEISLSGSLTNGLSFSAVDTIKVIDQGNEHVNEDDPSSIA